MGDSFYELFVVVHFLFWGGEFIKIVVRKFFKGGFLGNVMAGVAAVIVKIMLSGPDVDLESVKKKASEVLEGEGAQNISYEVEELAFGLKALMVKMAWDEEKETELIVEKLKTVEGVSEADIVDYRRAFG